MHEGETTEGDPTENRAETDAPIEESEVGGDVPPAPRRLRPVIKARPDGREDPNFGPISASAEAWTAEKARAGGGFEPLSFPSPEEGVDRLRWPMSELSVETLRSRWGPGDYTVTLYRAGGSYLKKCPMVRISAPPAVPPPTVAPSTFAEALTFMNAAKKEAQDTVQMVVALAGIGAQRSAGGAAAGEQMIQLMLEKQKAEMQLLFERQDAEHKRQRDKDEAERQRLQREIEQVRREREEDDGGGLVEGAAKGARIFRRGMGIGDFMMAFAAEHPEIAGKVVQGALQVAGPAAISLAEKMMQKPAPARPAAQVRRLHPVARETAPQGPPSAGKRPPQPATGLNAIATEPPRESPKAVVPVVPAVVVEASPAPPKAT